MRKFIFIVVGLFVSISCFSQVKAKRGIVSINGNPVVKVIGKVGAFKIANLELRSLSDTPILKISEEYYDRYKFPPFQLFNWYKIEFLDSHKVVLLKFNSRCNTEECIVDLLERNKIFIDGQIISNQTEIIEKFDYSPSLKMDTMVTITDDLKLQSRELKSIEIARNIKAPMVIEVDEKHQGVSKIVQDGKTIGWIFKDVITTWGKEEVIYKVYKSNSISPHSHLANDPSQGVYLAYFSITPFKSKGYEFQGFTYFGTSSLPRFMTMASAENELAQFLLNQGLL